jgi:transposase InsO family protein
MLTTSGGKFYLAAVIDLYSRYCVGWAVSAVNDRHVTMRALEMAVRRRCPDAGLLHHSDQGSTYASEDYQDLLVEHSIACSMSRRSNCLDNAAMESWFSTVKFELGETFESIHLGKEQLPVRLAHRRDVSDRRRQLVAYVNVPRAGWSLPARGVRGDRSEQRDGTVRRSSRSTLRAREPRSTTRSNSPIRAIPLIHARGSPIPKPPLRCQSR